MRMLERFLNAWYGPPSGQEGPVKGAGFEVEDADLIRWWGIASRWNVPLIRFNQIVRPEDLRSRDGKVVFLMENQGGAVWSFSEDPAARTVFVDHGDGWSRTGLSVGDFLAQMTICEAAHGAASKFSFGDLSDAPSELIGRIAADVPSFDAGRLGWVSSEWKMYVLDDCLIDVVEHWRRPGRFEVATYFADQARRDSWMREIGFGSGGTVESNPGDRGGTREAAPF